MADDIILTPEEQDERAKQWLKDNGLAIVVGISLGLGAVFGYNAYSAKQISDAEHASTLFQQALEAVQFSENADINEQLATLKADHASTPYAAKATLLRARQLSVSDIESSLSELQWVIDNANESGLQHTARIRKAKVELALGNIGNAKILASVVPNNGFESHYQELLGDIALAEQQFSAARNHYQQAIDQLTSIDSGYRGVLTIKMNRVPQLETANDETVSEDSPADATSE
jgi:predicted negative regulator of RcsB-dependent stress response